jgi:uncharacterized membrane protein
MSLDLAVVTFNHTEGADHAYADVLDAVGEAPWTREIAFVEHHRRDRIVVRGNLAGHYVDIEDQGDLIGKKTAEGALTGAVVGAFFGPPGFAIGIVAVRTPGGLDQASAIPQQQGALSDDVPADVPEGSSAVILLASPEHVDAMVAAFEPKHGRVVRRHLSDEAAQALEAAVTGSALPASEPDSA